MTVSFPYWDILQLDRPSSSRHPAMPQDSRAAQFAAFAALTGFEELTEEALRQWQQALAEAGE